MNIPQGVTPPVERRHSSNMTVPAPQFIRPIGLTALRTTLHIQRMALNVQEKGARFLRWRKVMWFSRFQPLSRKIATKI